MPYPTPLKSGVIRVNCVGKPLQTNNGAGYRQPTQPEFAANTKVFNRVGVGQLHPALPCRPVTGALCRA